MLVSEMLVVKTVMEMESRTKRMSVRAIVALQKLILGCQKILLSLLSSLLSIFENSLCQLTALWFCRDVKTVVWNTTNARELPVWIFTDGGKEIRQTTNSRPSLAYSEEVFGEVEYDGTFYINENGDNDWIGYIFSYQDNRNFYLFSASKWNITESQGSWTVKRIDDSSADDPREALQPHTEAGGKILWQYQPTDTPHNRNGNSHPVDLL